MMTNKKEEKNKKRGLALTIFLHTAVILIALYPFLISAEDPMQSREIAVEFVEFKPTTAGSSKSKAAKATKKSPEPKAKKEVKPTPKPKPKSKPTPKPKPVVTSPEPEKPIETSPKVEVPKKVKKPTPPAPPQPVEVEEVTETAEEASEAASDKISDTNESGGKGNSKDGNDNGSSDLEGEGEGDDFSGDGLFRRKVIYRADVKKLIKKNGKISVDLCVNRQGNVVSAEYNSEFSTITDSALIEKAVRVAKKYRFEKDNAAAKEQCGRLTFVCKVE